jgi:hypothetical protein
MKIPMTPQHILELEQLCDAPLPAEYLQLLDSYPAALQTACRADDGGGAEGLVPEVELLAAPEEILKINQEVRQGTILDPEGQEFRWPDQLLVIGETGDGDYYCLDTDGEHDGVLQFRHYAVEFEVIADSLHDFVEMLMDAFVARTSVDDDADEDDDDEFDATGPDTEDEENE